MTIKLLLMIYPRVAARCGRWKTAGKPPAHLIVWWPFAMSGIPRKLLINGSALRKGGRFPLLIAESGYVSFPSFNEMATVTAKLGRPGTGKHPTLQ